MNGTLIKADGTEEVVVFDGLKDMQNLVGGLIEVVPTKDADHILVVDEEGRLKNKPMNITATIYCKYGSIVGDVILMRSRDLD